MSHEEKDDSSIEENLKFMTWTTYLEDLISS